MTIFIDKKLLETQLKLNINDLFSHILNFILDNKKYFIIVDLSYKILKQNIYTYLIEQKLKTLISKLKIKDIQSFIESRPGFSKLIYKIGPFSEICKKNRSP